MAPFGTTGNQYRGLNATYDDALKNLETVIGRIPGQQAYDHSINQSRTFGDLTELLLNRAPIVVREQITGLLEKTYVSPFTQLLLPIRVIGPFESINFTWQEIHFNEGIAPQTEVLGVPKLFTHNKSKRGARAVRRMVGVKIESGFFMTPEGREDWRNQIEQMVTIIQNTNEYDIMIELLQTCMRRDASAREMNGPYNHVYGVNDPLSFEQKLELDRDMFAIVNKTPDSRGFLSLVTNLKTIMKRNGVEPDAMVVPPYMLGYYYTTKDDLWQFSSAGPSVESNRAFAQDIGGNGAVRSQTIGNLKLIDSYIYRPVKGARRSACDLLTVPCQIGEFYPMEIDMFYRDEKDFKNFKSSDRDIRIFNEDHSRFSTVRFIDALENTFRFKMDENDKIDGEGILDQENHSVNDDMFMNGNAPVSKWGDVDYINNDESIVRKVVQTMLNMFTDEEMKVLDVSDFAIASNAATATSAQAAAYEAKKLLEKKFKDALDIGVKIDKKSLRDILVSIFKELPVNFKTMKAMYNNDIYIPVDIILCRPWMTYNMSSVIVMKAGRETGETMIGKIDFNMTSNTQDRTLVASAAYYSKAIVTNRKNVVVAPKVFCQNYISGNNVQFVKPSVMKDEIGRFSGIVNSKQSLIALLVPPGDNVHEHNWIDFNGKNSKYDSEKPFHASTDYYTNLFGIDQNETDSPFEDYLDYETRTFPPNTICWLGHMEYGPNFSKVNINMGHLGPYTYDQVNFSRKEGIFEPVRALTHNVTLTR